jgi:hypothetical protein
MTEILKFTISLGINNNNNNNNNADNNDNNNNNTYLLIWALDSGKEVNYRQSYEKKTRHRNTDNIANPCKIRKGPICN